MFKAKTCNRPLGVSLVLGILMLAFPAARGELRAAELGRTRQSFNSHWSFIKADIAGAERLDFNDASWRRLDLPHDWGVEGEFDQSYANETAKLPYWGVGWYRKSFILPVEKQGRQFFLDVDGAMSHARVWVNGQEVGGWAYGYASWRVALSPHLQFGSTNVVAIRLDNPPDSSRWYPGGGIYRNVWLVETAPVHVPHWGVTITTPAVSPTNALVLVRANVTNSGSGAAEITASLRIRAFQDSNGKSARLEAAHPGPKFRLQAGEWREVVWHANLPNPRLWSPESPQLYRAAICLSQSNQVVDVDETTFGVRTIEFSAAEGFLLNGRVTELQGVCLHHDLGALGAAFNLRARQRQLELLKELGCNAIRSTHYPAEPELLDLCDRMGFLVMDEAFDAWGLAKRTNDYHVDFAAWAERDLRAMIQRDRNHPAVILYSLGNEVYEQREGTNAALAGWLARIAHEEDPTRPVNMALHVVAASTNGFQNQLDVFGYNYTPFGYADFRKANPQLPLVGSETASCVSSRGEYFFPVSSNKKLGRADFQCTSYDTAAPSWAYAPDVEFKAQEENPFVAGEFVWTGFDYLGEPTPFDSDTTNQLIFTDPVLRAKADADLQQFGKILVPSRSSYFGIFDLCGFRKDRFYLYQSRWRPELPMVHLLPHWNWPERVGQITPVQVYTSGDEVELFLNGNSLGRKRKGKFEYRLRWDEVVYAPGELRAVAYKNGKPWAAQTLAKAGPATALGLEVDRSSIAADGLDLAFVTVKVTDAHGRVVPRSKNLVSFAVEGPGEIVATDNGDATSFESFQAKERKVFNGLALVILKGRGAESGVITLTAHAEGLRRARIKIRTK